MKHLLSIVLILYLAGMCIYIIVKIVSVIFGKETNKKIYKGKRIAKRYTGLPWMPYV